jgi:hypothetical protein
VKRAQFWTMFTYGVEQVCSVHRSQRAAFRAAAKCENRLGEGHRVVAVLEVVPYYKPRRRRLAKPA